MVDEITELAKSLNVRPVLIKDVDNIENDEEQYIASRILDYDNRRGARKTGYNDQPIVIDWPLEKANEEARLICNKALRWAKSGFRNLEYAKSVYDRYSEDGSIKDSHYQQIDLSKPGKRETWEKDKDITPIGFGDEEVTDNNCEKNDDGTCIYKVRSMHFADPYGCECFNVVELMIKVEVVPSEKVVEQQQSETGQKRKSEAVSPKK